MVSADLAWTKMLLAALVLAAVEHGYRKRVYDETWSLFGHVELRFR